MACLQVVLHIHRPINTEWQPLHLSRTCTRGSTAAAGSNQDAAGLTHHHLDGSTVVDVGNSGNAGSSVAAQPVAVSQPQPQPEALTQPASGDVSNPQVVDTGIELEQPHPRQVYFAGSGRTVGGLNVLYFELGMLLLLTGALPVVFLRKRRYIRL